MRLLLGLLACALLGTSYAAAAGRPADPEPTHGATPRPAPSHRRCEMLPPNRQPKPVGGGRGGTLLVTIPATTCNTP